jgi:precorrin-6A/cobalt-precorrin-6A reductase
VDARLRLLILGGTTEASALARGIAGRCDLAPVLSLAGRTRNPLAPPIPFRIGGFGGVAGLRDYLVGERVRIVVDATHPFASQMSRHAAEACGALGVPLAALTRPAWTPREGDRWTRVADMDGAARALGERPRNVFLTVGALQLGAFADAPQHRYIARTIDPPAADLGTAMHRLILARGPFGVAEEIALMRDEGIEVLVTKNSGGAATEAKIEAARALGIEVVMVERPAPEDVPCFHAVDDVLAWIETHRAAP